MERKTHTIDASGKVLGRLAAEIAILLRGKHRPDFVSYKNTNDFVVVKNFEKIIFTGKKIEQKKYFRHSGYLGSLKEMPLKTLFKKDPTQALKKAVFGMLPKNRLRAETIKRLKFLKD